MIDSLVRNAQQGKRKIKSLLPIYGLAGTFSLIIKNTFWAETFWQLHKELSLPDPQVEPKIPIQILHYSLGLNLDTWAGRSEILKIRGEYGLEQFKRLLERGDVLFCAYWGDLFTGYLWLQFPPVEDVGYKLKDDEAYTHSAWTFEEYRGKRVLPALQLAAIQYTRNNRPDLKRIVTHITTWNKPSIAGDLRAGYEIVRKELGISIAGYHKKFVLSEEQTSKAVSLS